MPNMLWWDNHPYLFTILFLATLGTISNVFFQVCQMRRKKTALTKLIALTKRKRSLSDQIDEVEKDGSGEGDD